MITGISIENFKGIRERVEIELRPLTLLFGANSAGKSSILHALQYAAEVFERRNLDAGLIGDGAAGVDLGVSHNCTSLSRFGRQSFPILEAMSGVSQGCKSRVDGFLFFASKRQSVSIPEHRELRISIP